MPHSNRESSALDASTVRHEDSYCSLDETRKVADARSRWTKSCYEAWSSRFLRIYLISLVAAPERISTYRTRTLTVKLSSSLATTVDRCSCATCRTNRALSTPRSFDLVSIRKTADRRQASPVFLSECSRSSAKSLTTLRAGFSPKRPAGENRGRGQSQATTSR